MALKYDPQHIVLRPYGNVGANQVGKVVEIPDPVRAHLMVAQHLVQPANMPEEAPFDARHVILRPFGYVGYDQVGQIIEIDEQTRAQLMVAQHFVRKLTDEERAALDPEPAPEETRPASEDMPEPTAVPDFSDVGVRELPAELAKIDDPGVLRALLPTETRKQARRAINGRLAQLEKRP